MRPNGDGRAETQDSARAADGAHRCVFGIPSAPVAPETCRLNGTNYRCLTEVQAVGTAPRIDFNEPDMGKTLSLSQFCLARRALQLTLSRSSVFHQLNRVAFADKARLDDGAVERHSPVKLGSHLRFRVLC